MLLCFVFCSRVSCLFVGNRKTRMVECDVEKEGRDIQFKLHTYYFDSLRAFSVRLFTATQATNTIDPHNIKLRII